MHPVQPLDRISDSSEGERGGRAFEMRVSVQYPRVSPVSGSMCIKSYGEYFWQWHRGDVSYRIEEYVCWSMPQPLLHI